jgi:FkbM family methyltransferase
VQDVLTDLAKTLISKLPRRWQQRLRQAHVDRQLERGTFFTNETEFGLLRELVSEGDWVIDGGANGGHYTKRLSALVGPPGRVRAFEPVPDTFAVLTAASTRFRHANVSLFNAAVSDRLRQVGMSMPAFDSGLTNYYQAHIEEGAEASLGVLTMSIDALRIEQPIALVKIDAEGHEAAVIGGMSELLRAHRPTLILETGDTDLLERLEAMGYRWERAPGSSNVLLRSTS